MRVLSLALLIGCGVDADGEVTDPGSSTFEGANLKALSDGECPDLTRSGTSTFSSQGLQRDVVVALPDTVEPGMPALMVWHGLGDSAESMASWMALETFAQDHGMIVVVPDSKDRNQITWDPTGDADVGLFDDLRTCMAQELDIDLSRLYATGFSFGGLWTTWLTMNRAKTLATTLVMSGGTSPFIMPYTAPGTDLPVLVMWGGPTDVYGSGVTGVQFEDTSLDFSESLRDDGHFVAHCDHGGGHTVPLDIHEVASRWLLAHRYGEPSPFEGDFTGFPTYCGLP